MQYGLSNTTIMEKPVEEAQVGRSEAITKVAIIIPTMNEPAISKVIDDTRKALRHFNAEILVVDKSTDDTARKAKRSGAIIITQDKIGYGNAYLLGFRNVSMDADIVVMMDGDNTYDPYEIPLLIEPIINGGADIVLGNRFARMEEGAMNSRNKLGNRMITGTMNSLYKLNLKDSQTGFRALRKSALDMMEITSDGMPFASEMIIDAQKKSLHIVEVPITYRPRIGEAKLNAYKDGSLIFTLIIRMVRDYNPFMLFLSIGGIFILLSILTGSAVIYEWVTTGNITRIALTVLTAVMFLTGVQIAFFGLLADIILVALRAKR